MSQLCVPAYAKVNLVLNITGKRPDGYHNLDSVFQRISLHDRLTLEKTDGGSFELLCSLPGLPMEDNIVTKAYRLLRERFPEMGGLRVTLEKNIPSQAGMGGGSADCAAFLLACRALYDLPLSDGELVRLGAGLGADVPACLYAGATLAHGIGDEITPISSRLPLHLVVIKPPLAFSTPAMYRRLDQTVDFSCQPMNSPEMVQAMENGDFPAAAQKLYNVFELAAEGEEIAAVRQELVQAGASAALMSGSGSAVFGLFPDRVSAEAAFRALNSRHEAYLCTERNERGFYL